MSRKGKLAAVVLLLGGALVAVTAHVAPRALRERKRRALLDDTSTRPNRLDDAAWLAMRVVVLQHTAAGYAPIEECRGKFAPTDRALVSRTFATRQDTRVREDAFAKPRHVPIDRVVLLVPADEHRSDPGVAVIDSGLAYMHQDITFDVGRDDDGLTLLGPSDEVCARIRHVAAVREAFDDAVKPSASFAESLWKTDIRLAHWAALTMLKECGDDAVPVIERYLESSASAYYDSDALYVLGGRKRSGASRLLARELERELEWWQRFEQDPRTATIGYDEWHLFRRTRAALAAVPLLGDEVSRPTVRLLCDLFAGVSQRAEEAEKRDVQEDIDLVRAWLDRR